VTLTAIEQGDFKMAAQLIKQESGTGHKELTENLDKIRWIAVSEISEPVRDEKDRKDYLVTVSYELMEGTQVKNRETILIVRRNGGDIPWKTSAESILKMLQEEDKTG